jgi:peptidyl-prolyl cis-trans isomerase SurA
MNARTEFPRMTWKTTLASSALVAASLCAATAPAQAQQPAPRPAGVQAAAQTPGQPAARPAPRSVNPAAGVAAIVNDEVISTYDVNQRALLLLAGAGIDLSRENLDRARGQAIRDLVDERLQLQEARERKINVDPAQIDRQVAEIARQNGTSLETLRTQLSASGIGIQTLRAQVEADMAWRRLVNGRYGPRVRISEDKVTEALARLTANSSKPQALVSEILLAAESEEDFRQAEAIGQRLLEEIRGGAPFPGVARQFSSAPSSAAGGDLGWLAQGELRPEIQAVVDRLQPGQVSVPVRGPGGIYIVAVRDKRQGVDPSTATRVSLRQVTAPATSRAMLERQMRRVEGCDGLQRLVANVQGAQIVELGDALESELSPEVRGRIANLEDGDASAPYEAANGLAALVVCARQTGGGGLPSRQEIENRLYDQELTMLGNRYLRNLRRDSTIITR